MTYTWAMGRHVSRTIRKAIDPDLRRLRRKGAVATRSTRRSAILDGLAGILARVVGFGTVSGLLVLVLLGTLGKL